MKTRAQLGQRYNRDPRTIDRWVRDPEMNFPEPMKIGRSLLWSDDEIEQWERSLPRRRRSSEPNDFPADDDKLQVA
jgi:hypothetical protein